MVFSGYMPSSGIAGSYGNSMFNLMRFVLQSFAHPERLAKCFKQGMLMAGPMEEFIMRELWGWQAVWKFQRAYAALSEFQRK